MTRGRVAMVAAVAALVVGAISTWIVLADSGRPKRLPPARPLAAGAEPVDRAANACRLVEAMQAQVKSNASKERVFLYLNVAIAEIATAARTEPIWISLQSGMESIKRGFEKDDAPSSELGIAIARDQCRRAGIYLPGAVSPSPGG